MAPHKTTPDSDSETQQETPVRAVDSPKVWTTLLTNTKYLSGLLTLEYSLRKHNTKYPFLVLYTSTLEEEGLKALRKRGIPHQQISYLLPKAHKDYSNDTRFYDCWSKLQPFGLVEYERVVQLDSDMLVLANMDELMELPLDEESQVFAASHACTCNPLKKAHYPLDWVPANCGYTTQHENPDEAVHTGPSSTAGLGMCNGGLQVCNPSRALYNEICARIKNPAKTDTYDFADQSLLSDAFRGRWVPLSYKYNALKTMRWSHKEIWRDENVKNIHYILSPKPWEVRESDDETHAWWWIVNDERLEKEKELGVADGF